MLQAKDCSCKITSPVKFSGKNQTNIEFAGRWTVRRFHKNAKIILMNRPKQARPLYQQIARWRWVAPIIILILAALHELALWGLLDWSLTAYHALLTIALYGLSGSLVIWFALDWLIQNLARQEQTEAELRQAYDSLTQTHRQLLAVHDIGRELASAADMQQVLELAARAPTYLAGAQGSSVVTFDNEEGRLRLDMAWGLSDTYLHNLRRRVEAGIPASRCRLCDSLTAHVSGDCPLFAGMQDLARAEGIQSLVCLPIVREQKREGIISAYFPSPNGPPEEQVQLLNIVTNGIASALDSVRLRTSQMAAIYAVEHLTQTQQDLDDLLEQVLETSLSGWAVQGGAILLYNEQDGTWHRRVQHGLGDDPNHPYLDLALNLAEEARQKGEPVLIPDLSQHSNGGFQHTNGLHSAAAAPLISGGQQLGALVMVAKRPKLFQPRHAPFFSAIAHQAALAISNAQLHSRVQQMAVLEERYRLSREMHDGLAQTLGSLGWQLDHLKTLLEKKELQAMGQELADTRRMVREAYMDVREAIDGLRLAVGHPGGLAAALAEYVADFQNRTGITTDFQVDDEAFSLPAQVELQLLRIVQEGLTNIRKHAAAPHAWVRLQPRPDLIELTIADNGQGFDPHLPRGRHHLGLAGMRERVQSLGGSLTLATSPGRGTRITVTIATESETQ
jgi:signal transduction histidine kinase